MFGVINQTTNHLQGNLETYQPALGSFKRALRVATSDPIFKNNLRQFLSHSQGAYLRFNRFLENPLLDEVVELRDLTDIWDILPIQFQEKIGEEVYATVAALIKLRIFSNIASSISAEDNYLTPGQKPLFLQTLHSGDASLFNVLEFIYSHTLNDNLRMLLSGLGSDPIILKELRKIPAGRVVAYFDPNDPRNYGWLNDQLQVKPYQRAPFKEVAQTIIGSLSDYSNIDAEHPIGSVKSDSISQIVIGELLSIRQDIVALGELIDDPSFDSEDSLDYIEDSLEEIRQRLGQYENLRDTLDDIDILMVQIEDTITERRLIISQVERTTGSQLREEDRILKQKRRLAKRFKIAIAETQGMLKRLGYTEEQYANAFKNTFGFQHIRTSLGGINGEIASIIDLVHSIFYEIFDDRLRSDKNVKKYIATMLYGSLDFMIHLANGDIHNVDAERATQGDSYKYKTHHTNARVNISSKRNRSGYYVIVFYDKEGELNTYFSPILDKEA